MIDTVLLSKTAKKSIPMVIKTIVVIFVIYIFALKRPLYFWLFSSQQDVPQTISQNEVFIDIPNKKNQTVTINSHKVTLKLLKQYNVTARVGYIDRYDGWLGKWYRSSGRSKYRLYYDDIVPQDLTLAWGDLGHPSIFNLIDFQHEYRVGYFGWEEHYQKIKPHYKDEWWGNFHTIAATPIIQKGIDILKPNDVVTIEGYLLHWETYVPEEKRIIDFTSAIYAGEKTTQKIGKARRGGSGLCKQLYLTKLIINGFVFE